MTSSVGVLAVPSIGPLSLNPLIALCLSSSSVLAVPSIGPLSLNQFLCDCFASFASSCSTLNRASLLEPFLPSVLRWCIRCLAVPSIGPLSLNLGLMFSLLLLCFTCSTLNRASLLEPEDRQYTVLSQTYLQ